MKMDIGTKVMMGIVSCKVNSRKNHVFVSIAVKMVINGH